MASSSPIEAFCSWARLKKYRIEVTYGVYVFTPVEKVLFWTIFCFLFTVISFAAAVFTQRNVMLLIRYAAVYVGGDDASMASRLLAKEGLPVSGMTSLSEVGGAANSQAP
ncbi:hypothetical protein F4779DRAFT_626549 [Xylariaceae sp. FL0662B]|nr:hypothetical protein F4779DRAFT_626549 [Xylariaceae sp. FL0662B]